jgi:hypothetical protein
VGSDSFLFSLFPVSKHELTLQAQIRIGALNLFIAVQYRSDKLHIPRSVNHWPKTMSLDKKILDFATAAIYGPAFWAKDK